MMADFNLNAEVSMNVDPIKAAKTTVEKNLKSINKSLKAQRKAFKENEMSAEQLADREKLLGHAMKNQERIIEERNHDLVKAKKAIQSESEATEEQKEKVIASSRALERAQNELSQYENELKQTQSTQKLLGRSTDEVKNSLGRLKDETKLTQMRFKQSEKTMSDYENNLKQLSYTAQKQGAHLDLLRGNLKEVERAQGSGSRAADKLRNDILKESLAFQTLQGRIDETTDELEALQRQRAFGRIFMSSIDSGIQKMEQIGMRFRNFGYVVTGVIRGGLIANLTTLIPLLGSAVSLVAGLGGAATASAGGIIGLGGAYGIAMGSVMAFAGQATTALKMLEDGTLKSTQETRQYQSVLSALKSEWQSLVQSNQAAIFNTMANGINIARTSLTKLNPAITTTTNQIADASLDMKRWIYTSRNAKAVFNTLNQIGPRVFGNLLNAGQSAINGLANIFVQFAPLFTWVGQGIENMAHKFNQFANSATMNKGIANFINYTKTNLPIVGQIFGNIFTGIFHLFDAFSGHSHNVLVGIQKVTSNFKKWSQQMKRSKGFQNFIDYLETNGPKAWSVIKNITQTLWGLIKGMAPIGGFMLSIAKKFTSWTAAMTHAHPWIGKIIGALSILVGSLLALGPPFLIAKTAISNFKTALGGAKTAMSLFGKEGKITIAAQKTWNVVTKTGKAIANGYRFAIAKLTTSQVINTAKTKIAAAATKTWTLVSKGAAIATRGLGLAIRFMTGPVGLVITAVGLLVAGIVHLWKNNETFRNFVINAWNQIKQKALAVFGWLKPYLQAIWTGIKKGAMVAWNLIKSGAIATWNAIKFAVQNPIQALKLTLQTIWNGIKATAIFVWNAIKKGVMTIIKVWWKAVKTYFNIWKTVITTIFNGIKTAIMYVWNTIKTGVLKVVNAWWKMLKTSFYAWQAIIKSIFYKIKNSIVGIWQGIKTTTITVWNYIKNKVSQFANFIWTNVKNAFNGLWNSIKSIVSTIKSWLINTWKRISIVVTSVAKNLYAKVVNHFYNMKRKISSVINQLKNWLVDTWRYIKDKVTSFAYSLWKKVSDIFMTLWHNTKSIFNTIKNWLIDTWRYIKNKVSDYAYNLWKKVSDIFMTLWHNTKSIFSTVKSWLINTWDYIRNKVSTLAHRLWASVKDKFTHLWHDTRSIFTTVKNWVTNTWDHIKNSVISTVSDLWNRVKRTFNNMKNGLKGIIDKIKGFIGGMVDKVKSGLNKLIDGINWVGDKLGMDKDIPHLSTGTTHTQTVNRQVKTSSDGALKEPTMAIVGDKGKGNGPNGARQEMIETPDGKLGLTPNTDTPVMLGKGYKVHSADATYNAMHSDVPHLSTGTGGAFSWLSDKASSGFNWAKDKVGADAKWLKGKVGDVMDWIDKPSKLLDHVLKAFGVNFSGTQGLVGDFAKAGFKKLKKAAVGKIKSWFEQMTGGDGSYIKYLDNITTPYSPNGPPPGYAFNWAHPGIDLPYDHEAVQSTLNGKAYKKYMAGGFGNYVLVKSGALEAIYGHLSKIGIEDGQKVKAGDKLGISGGDPGDPGHGASTGHHLHYEMHKDGHPINPVTWLKKHLGGSGKWSGNVKKALKLAGLPTTSSYVKAWNKQIQTESSGNAKAIGGTDGLSDGRAKGLVQVKPGTFDAYKLRGHGNIMNGLDNLIAGMRYAKSKYGKFGLLDVIGHNHGYAQGTNFAKQGLTSLFENGGEIVNMRGGEQVIPNDVSVAAIKSVIEGDIFSKTQSAVFDAISRYADEVREKHQAKENERQRRDKEYEAMKEQNRKLNKVVEQMNTVISALFNIEDSSERTASQKTEINLDGKTLNDNNNEQEVLRNAVNLLS